MTLRDQITGRFLKEDIERTCYCCGIKSKSRKNNCWYHNNDHDNNLLCKNCYENIRLNNFVGVRDLNKLCYYCGDKPKIRYRNNDNECNVLCNRCYQRLKYNNKYGTSKDARLYQIMPYKDTTIEIKLQQSLNNINIEFEKHKPIFGQPDIFIKPNVCVFADGDYWHGLEKSKRRDREVNKTLKSHGYTVLRFWERDINNNINKCLKKILEHIE